MGKIPLQWDTGQAWHPDYHSLLFSCFSLYLTDEEYFIIKGHPQNCVGKKKKNAEDGHLWSESRIKTPVMEELKSRTFARFEFSLRTPARSQCRLVKAVFHVPGAEPGNTTQGCESPMTTLRA